MQLITTDQLVAILPMPYTRATQYIDALNQAMTEFEINTPKRICAFLANVGHESGNLASMVENLNYSAEGLARTWPGRYALRDSKGKPIPGTPNQTAVTIQHNPEAIANNVYAKRMGNGDEASGDGWKYRGRTPIGVTGADMYRIIGKALNLPLVEHPELLERPLEGCRAAAHFWKTNKINDRADVGDFDGCCDLVNIGRKTAKDGDAIGYTERRVIWIRARKVLNV